MKKVSLLILSCLMFAQLACQKNEKSATFTDSLVSVLPEKKAPEVVCVTDSFGIKDCSDKILKNYLDTLLADGFDFPIGDKNAKGSYTAPNGKKYSGWYKAVNFAENYSLGIHPGEDWNGIGGGDTDLGQAVYATARGKVIFAKSCPSPWGKVVMIEHRFIENGHIRKVYSQYAHLQEILVEKGTVVTRRQQIGKIGKGDFDEYPAHLHFEMRKHGLDSMVADYWPSSHDKTTEWVKSYYVHPTNFIKSHRKLRILKTTPQLVMAIKSSYKLLLVEYGKVTSKYEIALSQNPNGHKVEQGDMKLPEGEYRLCQKTKGPFTGNAMSEFFGPAWMRISYPNNYDAEAGLASGLIKKWQYNNIISANNSNKTPPKTTRLGGGIGIHGWVADDWDNNQDRFLTWGCMSMHNEDLKIFFQDVKLNTPIIILP